jgi:hypothetical protein
MRFGAVATSPAALGALIRQVDGGRLSLRQRQLNLLLDMYITASDAQRETQIPHKFAQMAEPRPMRRYDGDDDGNE